MATRLLRKAIKFKSGVQSSTRWAWLSPILIANAEEKRAIHYSREKVAPVLSGSLDSSFWSRLVLQVGDSEPAVRLAIMAVGSLFEHMEHEASFHPTNHSQAVVTGRRYQFAIQCYNKAISALMRRMEQGDSAGDIALLTCVLFICVEFLQGNEVEALALCLKGSKMLQSVPNTNYDLGTAPIPQWQMKSSVIMEDVSPTFIRLGILSTLFGQPIETGTPLNVLVEPPPPELSFSFRSLSEARDELYNLIETCQVVLCAAMIYKCGPDANLIAPGSLHAHKHRMLVNLKNWAAAFTIVNSSLDPCASYSDIYAATLLQLYHLIVYIWVSTCVDKGETVFDSHMAEFTSIVELSESLLAKGIAANALPHFTFEMGLIPPLYFTAINCRHPALRRKAVSLLRQGSRRESLWDAESLARVAERVIELEEIGLESGTDASPEERCRVHDAAISQRVLTRERNGYPIQFKLRPSGLDLNFAYVEEFISI